MATETDRRTGVFTLRDKDNTAEFHAEIFRFLAKAGAPAKRRPADSGATPTSSTQTEALRPPAATSQLDPSLTPIDVSLSPIEKARVLHALGREGNAAMDPSLARIDQELGFQSRSNFKSLETIVSKAARPSFQAK